MVSKMNFTIYLSGGHRSKWRDKVTQLNFGEYIDPSDNGLKNPLEYTAWDFAAIDRSDLVFAYMEATNPIGLGLAVEIGYAAAKGKYIILVDEKSKTDDEYNRAFAIVRASSDSVFTSMDEGVNSLAGLIACGSAPAGKWSRNN